MRNHPAEDPVPVSMPVIGLTVHEDGMMSATVDGQPLPPPAREGVWRRHSFPQIVDQVTADRSIPARIDVHEADGSTFTDIIPARPRTRPATPAPPAPSGPGKVSRLLEVRGEGFVPGEDVAVCRILRHTDATGTGTVRSLIDPAHDQLDFGDEVVLLGRVSGTVLVRGLS